jgi:hypothetical protein
VVVTDFETLSIVWIQSVYSIPHRYMAQAVSRRPLTADARVRSRVSLCGILVEKVALRQAFSPVNFILPVLHYT